MRRWVGQRWPLCTAGPPLGARSGRRRDSDRETLVGTTIETAAAADNITGTLNVPELGLVSSARWTLWCRSATPATSIIRAYRQPSRRSAPRRSRQPSRSGGLGFGTDDVNEKAAGGYQILNLGGTTAALRQAVDGWFDASDGVRATQECDPAHAPASENQPARMS
jgi:hypothetical protein